MDKTPTHCICGSKLVEGEAVIEPIDGVKMLVPALICLNEDCEMGFVIETAVIESAKQWATVREKEFRGIIV